MDNIILELKNIKKNFGDTEVLKGISIDINKGEFITLLGSSGCGKTTTIRIIAGLESLDSGELILNGKIINNLEANKRDINTIFQNYALFPNMNVKDNISYGLKIKKVSKEIIEKEVEEVLKLVQLEGFEKRMPNSLSGGQKQRVAIARAIINKPSVLLLDEPLGALDLKLRRQMQNELKNLQQKLGITFIYITHDQEEAINMSDRIVVMNKGEFEQIGTPNEIYYKPKTSYVATFVGNCNIYKENNKYYAIRHEHIYLSSTGKKAEVIAKSFVSGHSKITCRLEDNQILNFSSIGIDKDIEINSNIIIDWNKENQVEVVYNGE